MPSLEARFISQDLLLFGSAHAMPDNRSMAQRKRPTRSLSLQIKAAKPRNPVLLAAALGQVKLGTAKHEKSSGAKRQALKQALLKSVKSNPDSI